MQPPRLDSPTNQCFQAWLNDGTLPGVNERNLHFLQIHPGHRMAHFGETCGCYTAYVAHSKNRHIHSGGYCGDLDFACRCRWNSHRASVKLRHFSRGLVPESAFILLVEIFQKCFVTAARILAVSFDRSIKVQVIRMNVHNSHSTVFGDPIQFSQPNIDRLFAEQQEECGRQLDVTWRRTVES